MNNTSTKKAGFNWLAFLFSASYYSGNGKMKKGLLLALIGFFPLTQIGVSIYCGRKANMELSQDAFSWPKAIVMFVIHAAIMNAAWTVIQMSKH